MKKILIPSLMIIGMFGILAILILQVPSKITLPSRITSEQWADEDELEYANTLLAKGLHGQAAVVFEKYMDKTGGDKEKLAKISYRLGTIYMDLFEYEKALSSFYKAEMLDAQADFKSVMSQKIVEALENLGMSSQAQYELGARTALGKPPEKGAKIVARIGEKEITESEIKKAMDGLPEQVRKNFQTKEGRRNFIREYVAYEALYRKAKRLGLGKTPKIRENIEAFKKQLIVQQLLQKELERNLKITPEDLELYYNANKDKYVEPESVDKKTPQRQKDFNEVKEQIGYEYRLKKQKKITNSLLEGALEAQEVEIYYDFSEKKNSVKK